MKGFRFRNSKIVHIISRESPFRDIYASPCGYYILGKRVVLYEEIDDYVKICKNCLVAQNHKEVK